MYNKSLLKDYPFCISLLPLPVILSNQLVDEHICSIWEIEMNEKHEIMGEAWEVLAD